jgi:hypothetical protein
MNLKLTGVRDLQRRLSTFDFQKTMRPPLNRSVLRIEDSLKTAPPPIPAGLWAATSTAGQKRAYFAKVRRLGRHPGRTGTIARKWYTRIQKTRKGLLGTVGNNADAALWVHSYRRQQPFHANRWRTDRQAVKKNEAAIIRDFRLTIRRALRGL